MFDLFVRLIRVNLYVRFFVRFHVRFFARYFCPTCSCPIFFWFFDHISCPIFARFLSDFLCPIFFVRFFCTKFLSNLFTSDFLWPILLSYFCPIYFIRRVYVRFFVLFSLSDFRPIRCLVFLSDFLSPFLADLLSHFLCDFSSKKMEHVSSCNATFVMYYQCVSVFIIMTVSYTRMGVI